MGAEQDAHQIFYAEEEVRGVGGDGALDGEGVGQGLKEVVESRGSCCGAVRADPGIRLLGCLAEKTEPDQLPRPSVDRNTEILQHC